MAAHSPVELAALAPSAQVLTPTDRIELAEDFVRIRDQTGLLRRWEHGRVVGVPVDRYDPLLLECCSTHWTPAARVVGTAMGRCDRHNLISDLFFSSRLQTLIDSEHIEANGARNGLRDYTVRVAENPPRP